MFKKLVCRSALITTGCIFYAVAIALFLDPMNLAPGGVTGIAIIINHITDLPTGMLVLIINIPLMISGLFLFGKSFIYNTVFATVVSSFLIDLIENMAAPYLPVSDDLLLSGIVGGSLLSVGMGIIFRMGGTTGGSDIVVKLLRRKLRHVKTGRIFLITDTIIIIISAFVFRNIELALYAGISLFVSSYVLDVVLYGTDGAKLLFIISDKSFDIAPRILDELDIGATFLNGTGAYTCSDKKVLMCAARKQSFPKIREIVRDIDSEAFLIVTSATEIFGEGFKAHHGEEF